MRTIISRHIRTAWIAHYLYNIFLVSMLVRYRLVQCTSSWKQLRQGSLLDKTTMNWKLKPSYPSRSYPSQKSVTDMTIVHKRMANLTFCHNFRCLVICFQSVIQIRSLISFELYRSENFILIPLKCFQLSNLKIHAFSIHFYMLKSYPSRVVISVTSEHDFLS